MAGSRLRELKRQVVCATLVAISSSVMLFAADDSAREQLDRWREARNFDAALEYLERLQESAGTPQDLKEVAHFEIGLTHVEAARGSRDPRRRRSRLDKAVSSFRAFIQEHPEHTLVSTARDKLGNAVVELARISLQQAQAEDLDSPDSQRLLEDARVRFTEAATIFQETQAELADRLAKIKPVLDSMDPDDRKLMTVRSQYRSAYVKTALLIPAIAEEQAEAYPRDEKVRDQFLQGAAEEYEDVFRRYRSRLAGLYARMYQGRCYIKLEQHARALDVLDELLVQPSEPAALRMLKLRVTALAAECWLHDSRKNYQRAIEELGKLVDSFSDDEGKTPDALELQFALARAHQRFADQLAADSPQDPRIAESRQQAFKHARRVALHSRRLATAASTFLAALEAEDPLEQIDIGEVETFAELNSLGARFTDRLQQATLDSLKLKARLKFETDDRARQEMQRQLDAANNTARKSQDMALAAFKRALERSADQPIDDVSRVRYYTTYLLYQAEKYQEAAELGERLAREHPQYRAAPQSAQIAFASYLKLYSSSESDDDRALAIKKMRAFGTYILELWEDEPVGESVRNTFESSKFSQ